MSISTGETDISTELEEDLGGLTVEEDDEGDPILVQATARQWTRGARTIPTTTG